MARNRRSSRRKRAYRRPSKRSGLRTTPFFWMVAGIVGVFVVIIIVVSWRLLSAHPQDVATQTMTETTIVIETQASTPTLVVSTETPLPTEPPQSCTIIRNTEAHRQPKTTTIREPLESGTPIIVIGSWNSSDGNRWYRVIISQDEWYVPINDVSCRENQ